MFEERLKKFLLGIRKQCEKHYPNCENCPMQGSSRSNCSVRDFVHQLDRWPKDWDQDQIERYL